MRTSHLSYAVFHALASNAASIFNGSRPKGAATYNRAARESRLPAVTALRWLWQNGDYVERAVIACKLNGRSEWPRSNMVNVYRAIMKREFDRRPEATGFTGFDSVQDQTEDQVLEEAAR